MRHARADDLSRPLPQEALEFFRWLCAERGLDATQYRSSIFRRREAACLRALRLSSLRDARQLIERRPEELDRALGALMIGVTAFFRDPQVFRALEELIPTLPRHDGLRVLSVACSDGSELYSLGMLLGEARRLQGSRLLGLDCRPEAVQVARAGQYPAGATESVPPDLRARWLRTRGAISQVREELASACSWELGDALRLDGEAAQHDLILCRNLAIYLEHEAARGLWQQLCRLLRPGGLLVTGKAERPSGAQGLVRAGPCIYRRSA